MKYIVTAFRFYKGFDNIEEAEKCFEENKNDFTYCELKEIVEIEKYYYARSLKTFVKR